MITDDQVERACRAYWDAGNFVLTWDEMIAGAGDTWGADVRRNMRAALEAALTVVAEKDLPPLPEPAQRECDEGVDGSKSWPAMPDFYTAEQMHVYASLIRSLELCGYKASKP